MSQSERSAQELLCIAQRQEFFHYSRGHFRASVGTRYIWNPSSSHHTSYQCHKKFFFPQPGEGLKLARAKKDTMVTDYVTVPTRAPREGSLTVDDYVRPRDLSELVYGFKSTPHWCHYSDGTVLMAYGAIVYPYIEIPMDCRPKGHPLQGLVGSAGRSVRFQKRRVCSLKSISPPG